MGDLAGGVFTVQQAEVIRTGVRKREATRDPVGMRGVDRIEVDVVEGLSYAARNLAEPASLMHVGEPVERGGTGEGASPLSHFLAGAGSCLLNQFIRIAVCEGYALNFARVSVRGEFRREPGGGFERIACVIHAQGEIPDPVANDLTERAERLCYVHATLSRAIEMTTLLVIDGRERVRRISGPSAAVAPKP